MNKELITLIEQVVSEELLIRESIFEASSLSEIKEILGGWMKKGVIITAATIASIGGIKHLTTNEVNDLKDFVKQNIENTSVKQESKSPWVLACDEVKATVYHAVPEQCNADCGRTASMFRLNLRKVDEHRIIAMERTFMRRLNLDYGDVVVVKGAGNLDGLWQIQDLMNRRFKGENKIDFLVPQEMKYGKWDDLKIYKLRDGVDGDGYKNKFLPQLSKDEFKKQEERINKNFKS